MHVYGEIQGTLSAPKGIIGTLSSPRGIGGTLTVPAALLPPSFEGPYEVTPTEETQTLETTHLYMDDDITVNPIPEQYIVPAGTLEISQNGETDVTEYAAVDVDVQPTLQNKTVTVSSSGDTEITADDGYYGLSKATATVPTGSAFQGTLFGFIESGTKWRVRGYNDVNTAGWFDTGRSQGSDTKFNAVPSGTTVTPTESAQTVGGSDYMMQGAVTVSAIPSDYVGSSVPQKDSDDLTVSGDTVTAPSGYYAASASKTIPAATANTVTETVIPNTPTVSSTGLVSVSNTTVTGTLKPFTSGGYVGTDYGIPFQSNGGSNTLQLDTQSGTTISPSESQQTAVSSGKYTTGNVLVDAIPSNYIGSAIDRRDSSDLSASGATVTAPAGYYSAAATKSVASGTAGTPTASKGAVSNHSVTVTPSVTNTAGYISGGTKTGTGVSVSASELVSGTRSITSNGTGIDVKDYAAVDVNVSGSAPVLQTITKSYTPTESAQSETITANAGYDGIEEVDVTVSAISSTYVGSGITQRSSSDLTASGATVTAPSGYYASNATKTISSGVAKPASSISSSDGATITTETGKIVLSKTINNVPQVTAGYISSGTFDDTSVTLRATCSINGNSALSQSGSTVTALAGYYPSNATLTVSGGGSLSYDTKTATASNYPVSLSFTSMKGEPKFFVVRLNAQVSSSGSTTYYYIVDIVSNCNGSSAVTHGNCFRIGSTRRIDNITSGYSYTYSGTTLTITSSAASRSASPGAFYSGSYELIYAY